MLKTIMGFFNVNKKLWPLKAHYFLWNAGTAPVTPFLSVYAKQLGFSSIIVGIIYTILPVCGMLAKPIMGGIADKFHCQRKIFLAFEVLTAAMFLAILYIPNIDYAGRTHFSCEYGQAVLDTCIGNSSINDDIKFLHEHLQKPQNISVKCRLDCPLDDRMWHTVKSYWNYSKQSSTNLKFVTNVPLSKVDAEILDNCVFFKIKNITLPDGSNITPQCLDEDNKISSYCDIKCDSNLILSDENVVDFYQFWMFVVFMILAWVGQAVVVSFSDTICFVLLGDRPNKYGNQRCFGSLGWGIFAIITGVILDASAEIDDKKDYTYAFYLSFALLVMDFCISFKLETAQRNIAVNIFGDIGQLLADVRVCVFMVWCIFIGVCTGLIWNFLFWFIEELAGTSNGSVKTLEGLVMAIQCLGGELPLFFLSGWIVKRIGHINCMSLILFAMGVRFILYSLLTNPWYILPIEFLNGITFGLFYACMASYASIIAPPGTETTMQGLVGAVFEGIGASTGSLLGGYMFKKLTGLITYRIFGIISLILCLIHIGVQMLIQRSKKDLGTYQLTNDAFEQFVDDEQYQ